MAKSRKRARRPQPGGRGPSRPVTSTRPEPGPPSRRRRSLVTRGLVLVALVALGWLLLYRAPGPGTIPSSVSDAAAAAGCDALERPLLADPGRDHLAPGDLLDVDDPPPAAGPHDPEPLPPDPHVLREPVSEARAVHNLEHAYVVVWYRPATEGGISEATVEALERLAREEDRVIMAPYPDLPEGKALALVAWNTRWTCPSGVSTDRAVTIARAFIEAYRGTTNAPEAPRGLLGRLFVS